MTSRIAPSRFPKHIVEVGFLNDLTANLSLKQMGEGYDASVFEAERLAAWDYEHKRELARCTRIPLDHHESSLEACDLFIALLHEQKWQEAEAQIPAVRKAISEFDECTLGGGIKY